MKTTRIVIALAVLLALIVAFRKSLVTTSVVSEVTVPTSPWSPENHVPSPPQKSEEVAPLLAQESGLRPVTSWSFVGSATPKTAFESVFWAKENLEVIRLTSLLSVSPEALKRADEVLSSMSLAVRSRLQIHTPEALIAYLYAASPVIRGFRIATEQEKDLQNVTIDGDLEFETGRKAAVRLDFRLEPGGWRYVIDEKNARVMLEQWQKVWGNPEK